MHFSAPSWTEPRCRPSLPTLNQGADHTRRFTVFVRSIDLERIDHPNQSATLRLQILNPGCVQSPRLSLRPTHYDAGWFSSESSLLWASLLDARSLAIHLQWVGWSLVLATNFNVFLQRCSHHLQASSNKRTRTTIGTTFSRPCGEFLSPTCCRHVLERCVQQAKKREN